VLVAMTLQRYYNDLPGDLKAELAVRIARLTLPVWEKYAEEDNLIYTDTSGGITHKIDRNIFPETIKEIEDYILLSRDNEYSYNNSGLVELYENFEEPVSALYDGDWEVPAEVESSFYCLYNLLRELAGEMEVHPGNTAFNISVDRTIDTMETSGIISEDEFLDLLKEVRSSHVD